jgi:hypothetical protein
VSDLYGDFVQRLYEDPVQFPYMSVQFLFLAYLLLGQGLLLAVWRVLRRAAGLVWERARPAAPPLWGGLPFAVFLLLGQVALLWGWPRLVSAMLSADPILLADVVVTVHLAFVLAVLLTLVLVLVGWPLGWGWTRNFWFRLAQLIAIEIVAGQAIVGLECPLTTWERELRDDALHNVENASRIGAFCHDALFALRGERWKGLFAVLYSSVGLLVLLTWVVTPPRLPWVAGAERPPHPRDGPGANGQAVPAPGRLEEPGVKAPAR